MFFGGSSLRPPQQNHDIDHVRKIHVAPRWRGASVFFWSDFSGQQRWSPDDIEFGPRRLILSNSYTNLGKKYDIIFFRQKNR